MWNMRQEKKSLYWIVWARTPSLPAIQFCPNKIKINYFIILLWQLEICVHILFLTGLYYLCLLIMFRISRIIVSGYYQQSSLSRITVQLHINDNIM